MATRVAMVVIMVDLFQVEVRMEDIRVVHTHHRHRPMLIKVDSNTTMVTNNLLTNSNHHRDHLQEGINSHRRSRDTIIRHRRIKITNNNLNSQIKDIILHRSNSSTSTNNNRIKDMSRGTSKGLLTVTIMDLLSSKKLASIKSSKFNKLNQSNPDPNRCQLQKNSDLVQLD